MTDTMERIDEATLDEINTFIDIMRTTTGAHAKEADAHLDEFLDDMVYGEHMQDRSTLRDMLDERIGDGPDDEGSVDYLYYDGDTVRCDRADRHCDVDDWSANGVHHQWTSDAHTHVDANGGDLDAARADIPADLLASIRTWSDEFAKL